SSKLPIDLISETSMQMNIIQHENFKKVIQYINPTLDLQNRYTLWNLLERKTVDARGKLWRNYIDTVPMGRSQRIHRPVTTEDIEDVKNKDAIAGTLAKSQEDMGLDNIKPITMNETRWNSRYEMTKRVIKLKHHIDSTIDYFTANPNLLPTHIKLDELKSRSLSAMELDTLKDIETLWKKPADSETTWGPQPYRQSPKCIWRRSHYYPTLQK
ncbi:hypothetical protein BGZ98_002281, partial [Dissophora globulifera]